MEVILAKSAGFCWGVKRAIDMALDLRSHSDQPIQTLGPLIHNPQTLETLKSKQIEAIETLDELPPAAQTKDSKNPAGYVVIRAHGISPQTRQALRESGQQVVDATCPDVGVIAGNIRKFVRRGFSIIILGDPKHAEVIGLHGYSEGRGYVVEAIEDVAALPELTDIFVVSQSTLDGETWLEITQAIKQRWPQAVIKNTICDATTDRQTEIKELAPQVDVMVVVGGRNSSNTHKLVKISQKLHVPTYHIETEDELKDQWFQNYQRVGVTAGASTPNWLIMKVVKHLEGIETKTSPSLKKFFDKILEGFLHHHVLLTLGAIALSYVAILILGLATVTQLSERVRIMLSAGLFIYAMHSFHGSRDLDSFPLSNLVQWRFYSGPRRAVFIRSGLAFFVGLTLAVQVSHAIGLFYLCLSLLGFAYRLELLPQNAPSWFPYRSLMAIPGSRDIFMAAAWATMIVGLPALHLFELKPESFLSLLQQHWLDLLGAFAFVMGLVIVRSLVSDERDIKRDKLIGRETLPILLGRQNVIRLQWVVLSSLTLLMLVLGLMPGGNPVALTLLPAIAVTYLYVHLYHYKVPYRSLVLDIMADAKFLAIGLWTYAWLHWFQV